ncbi:MAG: hypothetical protein ABI432_13695 [Flavobacteriales bacterium]
MRTCLAPALLALPFTAQATIWQVGPGQTYTLPSQVSTLVANGDTVDIAAGTYPSDVARWQADDLLLRGLGGLAHLESNGLAWGDKAIWVIQGDRTTGNGSSSANALCPTTTARASGRKGWTSRCGAEDLKI